MHIVDRFLRAAGIDVNDSKTFDPEGTFYVSWDNKKLYEWHIAMYEGGKGDIIFGRKVILDSNLPEGTIEFR